MGAPQAEFLTSPIYGGGARRAEGAFAKVAPTFFRIKPLHGYSIRHPPTASGPPSL